MHCDDKFSEVFWEGSAEGRCLDFQCGGEGGLVLIEKQERLECVDCL